MESEKLPNKESACSTVQLLEGVGARVRAARGRAGYRIADLATKSGLSARFISDLERGKANISIGKLHSLSEALDVPLRTFLPNMEPRGLRSDIESMLDGCTLAELQRVLSLLGLVLGQERPRAVAMMGIRGAGKSSVGVELAEKLDLPFIELVSRIEQLAGIPQSAIFSFHGENYYRRLELQALTELVSSREACVVALPGGLVTHSEAFNLVKESCFSVWLRATPEEYLGRVYAQGDTRPMDGRENAMIELRNLVENRERLYEQANTTINTSGKSIEEIVERLANELDGAFLSICPFICESLSN